MLVQLAFRLVATGAVAAAVLTTGFVAVTMRGDDAPRVEIPVFAPAPVAAAPDAASGPPVTGAQIVAWALAPARDRTSALLAERARADAQRAEAAARSQAERDASAERSPGRVSEEDRARLAEQIRRACEDGRLRGAICG